MLKWFWNRRKRKPTQAELEQRLWFATVALAAHHGRRAAWQALTHTANVLAIPDSDVAVELDILHMEKTLS